MYRRTSRWLCVCLWLGCAAPEDKNPASRCSVDSECSGLQVCYRGYCLGDDDGVVSEVPWSSSDDGDAGEAADAGTPSVPPAVGGPKDAVAPSARSDAGASDPADAATTPAPTTPPVAEPPSTTAPTSDPPGSAEPPMATPTAPVADAGVPTSPPAMPPPATPPAPPPGKSPPPSEEPVAEAGSLLGALIEAGLAPASMLVCVPSCLSITQQRECERCIDRALKKDRGVNPCAEEGKPGDKDRDDEDEDDDARRGPAEVEPVCALWSCARGKCRGSS